MSTDELVEVFEAQRLRLLAVARRLLGASVDAEDAVQEAWIRLERHNTDDIGNLAGWLTTVVTRICLDDLRSRRNRATVEWDELAVLPDDGLSPAGEAELAESVGLALMVVMGTLTPTEQVALVLHDVFGLRFDEIAVILGKSGDAAKMSASRARRKVRAAEAMSADGRRVDRRVVDAFLAASRSGDLVGLAAVLDPEVDLLSDTTGGRMVVSGAQQVAGRAATFAAASASTRSVDVDGLCGVVSRGGDGSPMSLMIFAVQDGQITRILVLADPTRLGALGLPS